MRVLRIEGLPEGAIEAAAAFYGEWLETAQSSPIPSSFGEDLVLIFLPADHTHRAWRLAAVQSLARELAPCRVNAVATNDEAAIQSALAYLENAPGLTGQYLPLDGAGAGDVVLTAT